MPKTPTPAKKDRVRKGDRIYVLEGPVLQSLFLPCHGSKHLIGEKDIQSKPKVQQPIIETALLSLIIEKYEGPLDENDKFTKYGVAEFADGHHYEGLFQDGKMHGQGRFTRNDGVVFNGNFVDNSINGYGKYFWPDGSSYEGEVLDGIRHGKGLFAATNPWVRYRGEWNMGKKEGKGKIDYSEDEMNYYEGEFKDGFPHGYGVRQYSSGNIYKGEWNMGKRHGRGSMYWIDINESYNGDWVNGVQHGEGTHIWHSTFSFESPYPLKNKYVGEWYYGNRHGDGTLYYASGASYKGRWKNNLKCGSGKMTFKNGHEAEQFFYLDKVSECPRFFMKGVSSLIMPMPIQVPCSSPRPASVIVADNSSCELHTFGFEENTLDLDMDLIQKCISSFECLNYQMLQVRNVLLRNLSALMRIYRYYAKLGNSEDIANVDYSCVMVKMQLLQLLVDSKVFEDGKNIAQIDSIISVNDEQPGYHSHPLEKIFFRQLLTIFVIVAYHLYINHVSKPVHGKISDSLSQCLDKLIFDRILPNTCHQPHGLYYTTFNAAFVKGGYLNGLYDVFTSLSDYCYHKRKSLPTARDFLMLLKDCLLFENCLEIKRVYSFLGEINPRMIEEGSYDTREEISFLDFTEVLLNCANDYHNKLQKEKQLEQEESEQSDAEAADKTFDGLPQILLCTESNPSVTVPIGDVIKEEDAETENNDDANKTDENPRKKVTENVTRKKTSNDDTFEIPTTVAVDVPLITLRKPSDAGAGIQLISEKVWEVMHKPSDFRLAAVQSKCETVDKDFSNETMSVTDESDIILEEFFTDLFMPRALHWCSVIRKMQELAKSQKNVTPVIKIDLCDA